MPDSPVTTPCTPPGGEAITRASPPPAGSSHNAVVGSCAGSASGSGRAEVNSRSPSAVNPATDSPLSLRVSRRAGRAPAGSTSHRALV